MALQGAIYTAWALHKTSLLKLKAEQVQEEAKKLYHDETVVSHVLSTITSNVERMQEAHAMVNHIYQNISTSSGQMEAEKNLEEKMHELRKAQDALTKAVKWKITDFQLIECEKEEKLQVASSPVKLTDKEIEELVQIVKE